MHIVFCTPYGPHMMFPEHHRRKIYVQGLDYNHRYTYAEVDMNVVSLARNSIVNSIPPDADLTFWVDSDIILPDNALDLINYVSDEHPVVSGLYFSRRFPYLPQVYSRAVVHEDGKHPYLPIVDIPATPTSYDAVGAGFMVVRPDVFVRLKEAKEENNRNLSCAIDKMSNSGELTEEMVLAEHYYKSLSPWFEFLGNVGEDFYFCEMLAKVGIRPLLVPHVVAQHLSISPIGAEHYQTIKQQQLVYAGGQNA